MLVPVIVAAAALDPVADFADLGIDGASLLMNLALYKKNVETQVMISFDMLLGIFQIIDGAIEDFYDDCEVSKIVRALYDPSVLNSLLGNALNYGCSEPVVKQIDNPEEWLSEWGLGWFQNFVSNITGFVPEQSKCYDFSKNTGFKPDIQNYPDLVIWCSQEMKYLNARWY